MQDANGKRPAGMILDVLRQPQRFEFSQGLRLLSSPAYRDEPGGSPLRIRYRSSVSLSYPVGDIESIRCFGGGELLDGAEIESAVCEQRINGIEVTQPFLGLLGAFGTLSHSYTERVLDSERQSRDGAPRAFFDILIQRPVFHFDAAWRYLRPALGYETPGLSPLGRALRSLAGDMGPSNEEPVGPEDASPDDYAKALIGALRQRTLSARYVGRILSEVTKAPVRVEDHVIAWYPLAPELRATLGRANCTLGVDLVLGERAKQRQLRLRLHIGPLRLEQYRRFLPAGDGTAIIRAWLARTLGHTYEYEMAPILHREDVTGAQLGGPGLCHLGHDTYMVSRPGAAHRSDKRYLLAL